MRPCAWVSGALCVVAIACSKDQDAPPAAPSASAPKGATSAAPAPSASAAKPVSTSTAWAGTYTSAPGSLYVYDGGEWKGVHFRGDDASVGLGDGPIAFSLDTRTSVLRGTAGGPLGDAVLTGAVTNDEVTFTVLRKDSTDRGFTGTGIGKVSGDTLTGTVHLSRGDAHVIREAKFKLMRASDKP